MDENWRWSLTTALLTIKSKACDRIIYLKLTRSDLTDADTINFSPENIDENKSKMRIEKGVPFKMIQRRILFQKQNGNKSV